MVKKTQVEGHWHNWKPGRKSGKKEWEAWPGWNRLKKRGEGGHTSGAD